MASSQHRCVFVGNIPYDATEEQLIEICQEVGPVVSFRLVIDRETGKPKGYGFCEYKDEETALSARRNLQGYEINGRQLRVDFAENDKGADRNREQGRGGPGLVTNAGGPTAHGESSQLQPIGLHIAITAAAVMAGALGGAQAASNQNILQSTTMPNDPLTLHLAKLSRSQLTEAMSGLKVMATQNKDLARQLLLARPQLSKALFQSQIMLGMVTPQVLQNPNLRQPSTHPQLPLHDIQQGQSSSLQIQPGLPPLAPNRMQTGFVPKKETQVSLTPQNPLAPHQFSASQRPPLQSQIQPSLALQGTLTGIPGGSLLPSVSLPGSMSVRQQVQVPTSASLKQHMRPPSQQYSGHGGAVIPGHNAQIANPEAKPSLLPRPSLPDADFQPGSSAAYGASQIVGSDADRSSQVPLGVDGKRKIPHGFSGTTNRPVKHIKLEDGKGSPFSAGGLSASVGNNGARQLGIASDPNLPGIQISEKPTSMLPHDVESALLQQVLNLTPEQLNSLPLEQRQQVIQLQQALRRDQMRPS
ncbi:cleavage stimulating factor 64 [Cucurbita pepo subsp. pepo]|uniref:cleavage stimulating factor 64 n=1 Tax=Cucurbita pepo subsp. pepo TaxID=3664 RepID=UPI000C9D331A|nr:cleavage stimulating factor 64 [Cucurbita pepo subsp. pepo]